MELWPQAILINDECYQQIFTEQIKVINKSQWMFKVSSFGLNTCTETSALLVNGVVNNVLFHSIPHVSQTLPQIVHVLKFHMVDLLLHQAPDFVVNSIEIGAVWQPQSDKMKTGLSHSRSSDEPGVPEHCPEIWSPCWRCEVCPAAYVAAAEHLGSRLHSPWLQARRISNQCGPVLTHRPTPSVTGWTWIACEAGVSWQHISSWRQEERTLCHSVGSSVQQNDRLYVLAAVRKKYVAAKRFSSSYFSRTVFR